MPAAIPKSSAASWRDANSAVWPLMALGLLCVLQFSMIFTRAVNWDEFSYWREVAYFADGRLDRPLQTFHVHLFAWLAGSFDTSVDHILAARIAMFGCELITLVCLFLIGRKLAGTLTAYMVPLLYLSAGYVLQHGMSFRVDPLATAALCGALCVLINTRLNWKSALFFGALAAFAAMISIKVILYLPAFAGIAAYRWLEAADRRDMAVRIISAGLAAAIIFAALFWLHSQAVTSADGALGRTGRTFESAGNWVFFIGIPPYWQMMLKSAAIAPVLATMIVAAPIMLARMPMPISQKCALGGLWMVLLSLFFYKNTAAYFYVFLFAPLSLACIPAIGWALKRYSARMLSLVLVLIALGVFATEDRTTIDRQRQLVTNVQQVFGQPVAYFDHNFMMGGWPKANHFMTPWLMEAYHREGQPVYRETMEAQSIPLLLANSEELLEMLDQPESTLLVPEDAAALRANYIELSWPIWVAGKNYDHGRGAFTDEFLVPGPYTVHGAPIRVDGIEHQPGAIVTIARGLHSIEPLGSIATRLMWGNNLQVPSQPLEPGPLYVNF